MSRVMLLLQIEDKSGAHTILHDDLGLKSTLIESHFSLIRVSSRVSFESQVESQVTFHTDDWHVLWLRTYAKALGSFRNMLVADVRKD